MRKILNLLLALVLLLNLCACGSHTKYNDEGTSNGNESNPVLEGSIESASTSNSAEDNSSESVMDQNLGTSKLSLYPFRFSLDEVEYQIPFPLHQMTDNGWSFQDFRNNELPEWDPNYLRPGYTKKLYPYKEGISEYDQHFFITVRNDTDYEMPLEECPVIGIWLDNVASLYSDVKVAGVDVFHMGEKQFFNIFGKENYSEEYHRYEFGPRSEIRTFFEEKNGKLSCLGVNMYD